MECRVEFDYMAQEPDELTIKKGDLITNVVTKMDGWYEGTLNGKTGVFPDNFVKIIEKQKEIPEKVKNTEGVVLRNNPSRVRRVKVLFSYAPEQEDELGLNVGDVLDFIAEVEEGWWRGRLNGKEGIFPSNFVQEMEEVKTNGNVDARKSADISMLQMDRNHTNHSKVVGIPDVVPSPTPPTPNQSVDEEPAPQLPPKPVRELARCFYPYKAQNEDELSLAEGDIITIISKQCEDEGWWRGENRGKIGMFPDNFVKIIAPGEAHSTASPSNNGPQPKLLAQDRNINLAQNSASDLSLRAKKDSIGASVVDGVGSSKMGGEKEKTPEPKLEQTKKIKATSPGIAAFHTNLFTNPNQKPDAFARRSGGDPILSASNSKEEKQSDESEEFNSVERTETLNHLTATRAKAPKRRPPSAVITRDNEMPMLNGSSSHSFDNSMPDSPPPHHSTPNNSLGATSNGTSGSFTEHHSGSFLSQSRDKEASPTPTTNNKPKKQAPPWMSELKQTQEKKRGIVSPAGNSTVATASPSSSIETPPARINNSIPPSSQTPQNITATPPPPATKEPVKAPPLPAKPSSLSTATTTGGQDKAFNNLNHSSSFGPTNKPFPKKSPSPAPPNISANLNSNTTTSDVGDSSNKGYVTYEEHAALREKVASMQSEIETLKRQIKILMDRDLRGHIV